MRHFPFHAYKKRQLNEQFHLWKYFVQDMNIIRRSEIVNRNILTCPLHSLAVNVTRKEFCDVWCVLSHSFTFTCLILWQRLASLSILIDYMVFTVFLDNISRYGRWEEWGLYLCLWRLYVLSVCSAVTVVEQGKVSIPFCKGYTCWTFVPRLRSVSRIRS